MNARFLLVLGAFALCCVDASAAPSVRVLGAGNSATAAKTTVANTGSTASSVKKASVKMNAAPVQQILKPAATNNSDSANRANPAVTATTGRLPVITNKNNLQTSYKPTTSAGTSIAPGVSSADFAAISDKIDSLEAQVQNKANTSELDNFYDKDTLDVMTDSLQDDIDALNDSVDSSLTTINSDIATIQGRLDALDAGNINELREEVSGIKTIITGDDYLNLKTIYDYGTNSRKKVRLVGAEEFNKNEALGITSGN